MTKTPDTPERACTMCGVVNADCMEAARKDRSACCGVCMDGNTHPAPGERNQSCAEWGEQHGAETKTHDEISRAEVERLIEKLR